MSQSISSYVVKSTNKNQEKYVQGKSIDIAASNTDELDFQYKHMYVFNLSCIGNCSCCVWHFVFCSRDEKEEEVVVRFCVSLLFCCNKLGTNGTKDE